MTHQIVDRKFPTGELVYFIQIGQAIKIGFTTNLNERIKGFRGHSAESVRVLALFRGTRELENRLHRLFAEARIRNEFFRGDHLIWSFIDIAKQRSIVDAIEWVEQVQDARKRAPTASERMRMIAARKRWDLEQCIAESNARHAAQRQEQIKP
jgi:hypothetical protein